MDYSFAIRTAHDGHTRAKEVDEMDSPPLWDGESSFLTCDGVIVIEEVAGHSFSLRSIGRTRKDFVEQDYFVSFFAARVHLKAEGTLYKHFAYGATNQYVVNAMELFVSAEDAMASGSTSDDYPRDIEAVTPVDVAPDRECSIKASFNNYRLHQMCQPIQVLGCYSNSPVTLASR